MKISDTVMSYEKTKELDIIAEYLPESIRDTAFVWLGLYNTDTGEQEKMLLSRDYVNKMKPEGEIRPALSVYDMLKLIGPSAITTEMLLTNESFMNTLVDVAGRIYRTTIAEVIARDNSRIAEVRARDNSRDYGTSPSPYPRPPAISPVWCSTDYEREIRPNNDNDLDL